MTFVETFEGKKQSELNKALRYGSLSSYTELAFKDATILGMPLATKRPE